MKSSTTTLIAALRILAVDIQSGDGVANLAIAEAADRLEELDEQNKTMRAGLEAVIRHQIIIAGPAADHSLIVIIAKKALQAILRDIHSGTGLTRPTIANAADRLEELSGASQDMLDAVYAHCDFLPHDTSAVYRSVKELERILKDGN